MTIHLPPRLENPILAAVHSGRYASLDDAMTNAASMLVERLELEQAAAKPPATNRAEAVPAYIRRLTPGPDWRYIKRISGC